MDAGATPTIISELITNSTRALQISLFVWLPLSRRGRKKGSQGVWFFGKLTDELSWTYGWAKKGKPT